MYKIIDQPKRELDMRRKKINGSRKVYLAQMNAEHDENCKRTLLGRTWSASFSDMKANREDTRGTF